MTRLSFDEYKMKYEFELEWHWNNGEREGAINFESYCYRCYQMWLASGEDV